MTVPRIKLTRPDLFVLPMDKWEAALGAKKNHYLHRAPPCSFAYQLTDAELLGRLFGFVTFGTPPSRHLMISACKSNPDRVVELNRLWVDDRCPKNTESWFVSRALKLLHPMIVVSYADTEFGHNGYIYRALNFNYAGVTDMDRETPRFDYVTPGKHSRDTTRNGTMSDAKRVRRKPKHRYWTVTGNRREKRELMRIATWPKMPWGEFDSAVRIVGNGL